VALRNWPGDCTLFYGTEAIVRTQSVCAFFEKPREGQSAWPARKREVESPGKLANPSASFVLAHSREMLNILQMIRLDYLSCVLTVLATVLIGKKLWQGWVIAGINSAVVCVIGIRTAQFGFVPANLVCIAIYTSNLFSWRFRSQSGEEAKNVGIEA
jgi:hypothetical protein